MRKFLVFAPAFDENNGGAIALHKLCHVLNQIGQPSALVPYFEKSEIDFRILSKTLPARFKRQMKLHLIPYGFTRRDVIIPLVRAAKNLLTQGNLYRTHPDFQTPVVFSPGIGPELDDYIVIYPEIVSGNPLDAKNVVRWLLYEPGGHTGIVNYGTGELIVRFGGGIRPFEIPGSTTLKDEMKVIHYPLDLYHPPPAGAQRTGTAHLVRKGVVKSKTLVHHPPDSVCIDGLSHREISNIFQKVQTFVSYDSYTAYSLFAALTDCDSIVVPDDGVSEDEWLPDPANRYGIAYGWDKLDHARETRPLVRSRLLAEEEETTDNVRRFVYQADCFFQSSQ